MHLLGHVHFLLLGFGAVAFLVIGLAVLGCLAVAKLIGALVCLLGGSRPACRYGANFGHPGPRPQPARRPAEVHRPAAPVVYPVRGGGHPVRRPECGTPAWSLLGVGLVFFCIVAFGFRMKNFLAADGPGRPVGVEEKVVDASDSAWTVTGYGDTEAVARQDALEKAYTQFLVYLRNQDPPVQWQPSLEYLRGKHLKKDWGEAQSKVHDEPVGKTYQIPLRVEVTPQTRKDIAKHELEARREGRMTLLAKMLVGLVVLLALVAGYVRLDEWSKGYYTGWLRLTAASFLGAAGAAVWFLARY